MLIFERFHTEIPTAVCLYCFYPWLNRVKDAVDLRKRIAFLLSIVKRFDVANLNLFFGFLGMQINLQMSRSLCLSCENLFLTNNVFVHLLKPRLAARS